MKTQAKTSHILPAYEIYGRRGEVYMQQRNKYHFFPPFAYMPSAFLPHKFVAKVNAHAVLFLCMYIPLQLTLLFVFSRYKIPNPALHNPVIMPFVAGATTCSQYFTHLVSKFWNEHF